ncbi:transporter substrate-binding domain-containing protein, partial [Desulfobacter sp.]
MKQEKFRIIRVFILSFFSSMMIFQGLLIDNLWAVDDESVRIDALTNNEIIWLKQHSVIRIAPDPSFQPIEFFDKNGKYSGVGADYAKLVSEKLGITFEVVRCKTWDEVIAKVKRREVDVLNAVVKTPQREEYLNFTSPYLKIPSVIIVRKNVTRNLTLDMLKGMNVIMISGYGYVDLIRNKYPQIDISLVPKLQTALQKVSFGMVDAFVGDLATASFYIESQGITNLKSAGQIEPANISGFAVRSDWPELTNILEKGIALLTDEERTSIYKKWIHLGPEPGITKREFKNAVIGFLMVVVLICGIFFAWNRMLNTKIVLKTKDLKKEIEERKLIEDELKAQTVFLDKIIETSAISMWISDKDGTIIRTNPACLEFFGATEEEVVGKYNLFQDSVIQEKGFMPVVKDVFEKGKPASFVIDYDFGAVDHVDVKNATHKIIKTVLTPVLDNNKKVSNVIVQAIDITELKQSEKEKISINKVIAEHEKLSLIGRVAGKMAHDFNNILGIIMGNSQLALAICPDDKTKDRLELIYNQTIRGKNLTKNLVAFAKDQEPKQEFFSIEEKIDLVLNLLKKDLEGIHVMKRYSQDIPDLLADSGMIEHAVVNLFQNAIHAVSLADQPQIIVHTYYQEELIFIEIEDNGCGIPSECLDEIYEPSFTLKGSKDKTGMYKPGIKGSGYGMSNVKKYIEQHKGSISIHSELQTGTKVTIKLPVIKKELTNADIQKVKKET